MCKDEAPRSAPGCRLGAVTRRSGSTSNFRLDKSVRRTLNGSGRIRTGNLRKGLDDVEICGTRVRESAHRRDGVMGVEVFVFLHRCQESLHRRDWRRTKMQRVRGGI